MGRATFEGMTAGFSHMLSTSIPIGQSQKQSSVTLNFPNEKSPLQYSLWSKFFNHFFIFLKQDNGFWRPFVKEFAYAIVPLSCLTCLSVLYV